MKAPTHQLVEHQFRRFGFIAEPSIIRALIGPRVVGVYLLLQRHQPVYVGRSDRCLRSRLGRHPLLGHSTHVVWQPFGRPEQAYFTECAWYHELKESGRSLNQIHPARPWGASNLSCPHCLKTDAAALAFSLPPRHKGLVNTPGLFGEFHRSHGKPPADTNLNPPTVEHSGGEK